MGFWAFLDALTLQIVAGAHGGAWSAARPAPWFSLGFCFVARPFPVCFLGGSLREALLR